MNANCANIFITDQIGHLIKMITDHFYRSNNNYERNYETAIKTKGTYSEKEGKRKELVPFGDEDLNKLKKKCRER